MEENKRQLCVFKIASDSKEPWKWWDYAAGFAEQCTMQNGRFADRCSTDPMRNPLAAF